MATRKKTPEQGPPQLPPEQALHLLKRQIDAGKATLAEPNIDQNEFGQYQLVTKNVLEKAFGANSPNVNDFEGVARLYFLTGSEDSAWWQKHYRHSLESQI